MSAFSLVGGSTILVELIASIYSEDEGDKFLQKLVSTYSTTQCHSPEDCSSKFCCHENLRFHSHCLGQLWECKE
jgi:hypothetical protein